MQYSAITIQGNIISGEILEKIRIEDIRYQSQADFGLDKNTTIRDEIGIAWAAARAHWTAFKLRRERLKETDSGTSETRQSWMIPFFRELGYELEKSTAELINGKSYAISHRAVNRDGFPVHIVGINQSLDKRAETGGTRLSPHALIQEYLNNHEHLFALVTNGQFVRLLRDATRLSRLSYLEFDLERIMEEELFAEFALLYRVLHVTRMPDTQDSGEESVIEFYHQEALNSGSRIREKLSEAVEQSLKLLGNGLLHHPANETLRADALSGQLQPNTFYLHLLRVVYRTLFLMVTEERRLIYPEKRDEETNRKRDIYYRYYSIGRLTRMAEKQIYVDPRKTDLWRSLLVTFRLFENETYGEKLGIKPLGSGLFAPNALGSLKNQELDNGTLLNVLNLLVTFENENRQRVRVNYADLDVEEFGSVYEGLLEYDPVVNSIDGKPEFSFVKGEGRSSSGSHYTPEELVKPLIKHSLDYIIEERLQNPTKYVRSTDSVSPWKGEMSEGQRGFHAKDEDALRTAKEASLLSISVADVACGSGHILLSAARRIALELARVRTGEDQPAPPAIRKATRDVIRNCIYGVDLNPLAVELCKVALWLEAHNPGEPLNFLDHRIKCGNSIVGLAHKEELKNGIADEAFKTLPGDEKEIAVTYRNKNKAERKLADQTTLNFDGVVEEPLSGILEKLEAVNNMPETTPQEIEAKQHAYNNLVSGPRWWKLKTLADIQVAQFFIPKTKKNKEYLVTDSIYRNYLNGQYTGSRLPKDMATEKAYKKRFFHWFLEFPEIFVKGGFDCIVGNPPYVASRDMGQKFGEHFQVFCKSVYPQTNGKVDLSGYFVRRVFNLLNSKNSKSGFITTNTISQGDTRKASIEFIINHTGGINFAQKSIPWPGEANTTVSIFTIFKGQFEGKCYIKSQKVNFISSFFEEDNFNLGEPHCLFNNKHKSSIGSQLASEGFKILKDQVNSFIKEDKNYKNVIYDFISGDDINNLFEFNVDTKVVDFQGLDILEINEIYPKILKYLEINVKPDRQQRNDETGKKIWWEHLRNRKDFYEKIRQKENVLVGAVVSKYPEYLLLDSMKVYNNKVVMFDLSETNCIVLNSTFHKNWVYWRSTTMGASTINYTTKECFETFPFLNERHNECARFCKILNTSRFSVFTKLRFGLTKTYNAFHAPDVNSSVQANDLEGRTNKVIEKKYGKEVWNLWNHLQKTENTCTWEEAVEGIEELRRLHVEMDLAVLEAYGWHEDSEKWGKAIALKHDFYEVDYLPENDRVRFTIHPNARKEVLKRLLLLNHERYEEEIKQGLHKKKDVEKFYVQKGQPVPAGVVFADGKAKKKTAKKKSPQKESIYNQPQLFDTPNLYNQPEEKRPLRKVAEPESGVQKQPSPARKIEWHHSTNNFKVTIRNSTGQEFHYHVLPAAQRGKFTKNYKQISPNSPMALNMIGKQEGDSFEFGGMEYRIEWIEV